MMVEKKINLSLFKKTINNNIVLFYINFKNLNSVNSAKIFTKSTILKSNFFKQKLKLFLKAVVIKDISELDINYEVAMSKVVLIKISNYIFLDKELILMTGDIFYSFLYLLDDIDNFFCFFVLKI